MKLLTAGTLLPGAKGERQILDWSVEHGERPQNARARSLFGLLTLSEGNAAGAVSDLLAAVDLLDDMGIANPVVIPAIPDAIEALAWSGNLGSTEPLLARLEHQANTVNNPLVSAVADRCRGVVLAAKRDTSAGATLLSTAAEVFDELGYRLEAARTVLALGRALLRGGQRNRAADALAEARRRFDAIGAPLWEARAAEDLDRAAPGRAGGGLTSSEQRIAALVAQGKRNREIGQTLFVSVATVEAHLTRIYRKLQIRSRSELARRIADGSVSITIPERV